MEMILHNEKASYEAGQTVSGVLKVGTDSKPTHVRVELNGYAKVDWIEMPVTGMYGSVALDPDLIFHEDLCCLNLVHEVFDQDILIFNYDEVSFEFELPDNGKLPSSYKSEYAKIVYRVVATIQTEDGHTYSAKKVINVLSPIRKKMMVSVASSVEKDFGLLSFGSGRVILHAKLRKKGFYPGENMELHCSVFNMSSVECRPRATVYQTRVYLCADRQKASQLAITDAVVGDEVKQNIYDKQSLNICIPRETSLTIKSDAIVIKYFIHVTLDIPHAFDIHVNLPFVVTTKSAIDREKRIQSNTDSESESIGYKSD